jgi:glycosyltransferase involved in cell wall biosynthesis
MMSVPGATADERPLVSVIIPTCDRPLEFLLKAIASARAQSLAPHEILVVDNGNTPVSASELPEGVSFYRLKPRVGPSRARNFGAAMALGEYLAFLDDDDWWEPDFLSEAHQALVAGGVRCVYGRKDIFRNGQQESFKTPKPSQLKISYFAKRNPGLGGQNLFIDKKLFWLVGGFDVQLMFGEDLALALDIMLSGEKVGCAPKAIAVMRNHDGEHLRHRPLRQFRFIWKYRKTFSLAQKARMTRKTLKFWIKSKF